MRTEMRKCSRLS